MSKDTSYISAIASGSQLLFHHERILAKLHKRVKGVTELRSSIANLSYEIEQLRSKVNTNSFSNVFKQITPKTTESNELTNDIKITITQKENELQKMKRELSALENREEEAYYLMAATPYLNELTKARQEYCTIKDQDFESEDEKYTALRVAIGHIQNIVDNFISKFVNENENESKNAKREEEKMCSVCPDGIMYFHEDSMMRLCSKCGMGYYDSLAEAKSSYERMKRIRPTREFTYKRLTHFRNTLKQACGVSCKTVPDELKQKLREECVKRRKRFVDIKPNVVRAFLKKLGYSTYYEETVSITCDLNPTYEPLSIPAHHFEELCFLFTVIEEPFERVKNIVNETRQNFMSYPYTAAKLCEHKAFISDNDEDRKQWLSYINYFDLLKGVERLIEHDKCWKLVCKMIRWQYFNTIGNVSMSMDYSTQNDDDNAFLSEESEEYDETDDEYTQENHVPDDLAFFDSY